MANEKKYVKFSIIYLLFKYRICSNSSRSRFEAALKLKPHLSVFEKIQAAFELKPRP
jgi:hypothetical protein